MKILKNIVGKWVKKIKKDIVRECFRIKKLCEKIVIKKLKKREITL
jgi:hypothetical protein